MELKNATRPAYIESARVTEVYPEFYQIDVSTVGTQKLIKKVAYASPYLHGGGHGISFVPERGSLCWVMIQDSDPMSHGQDYKAFVIAWQPPKDMTGGHASNRPTMNPGDLSITTKSGGKLLLRSSGLIEIGSNAMSKTVYIPTTNTIHQLCQNLKIDTVGGFMHWVTHTDEDNPDNPATFVLGIRKLGADKNAYVKFEAGDEIGGLSITVMKDGSDDSLSLEDGKPAGLMVKWDFTQEGDALLNCKATFDVSANDISIKSIGDASIDVGEILRLTQKSLEATSQERIKLEAPEITIVCGSLNVVTPTGVPLLTLKPGQPALLNETILPFITGHKHAQLGAPPVDPVNAQGAKSKSSGIA